MCAVVTASLTLWQPAVLGSTRTPSARMIDQKLCPRALAARLAAQRHRDHLGARRLDRIGQHLGRGIARRAEQQPRGQLDAVERHGQPPCIGATTSISSPSLELRRSARRRRRRSGRSPPSRSCCRRSPARRAPRPAWPASMSCRSPLMKIRMSLSRSHCRLSAACRAIAGASRKPCRYRPLTYSEPRARGAQPADCRERPAADRRPSSRISASPNAGCRA